MKIKSISIFCLVLLLTILGTSAFSNAQEQKKVRVYLNNQKLSFDTDPIIMNDRTLVPYRAFFESLGVEVSWDEKTQTVTGKKGTYLVTLHIDDPVVCIGDRCTKIDVAPKIINNRTMVPLRFISESLGAEVDWDGKNYKVYINAPWIDTSTISKNKTNTIKTITADDFENTVLESETPVFVDIFADWCQPCKKIEPVIEEVAEELSEHNIKFIRIDGDKEGAKLNNLGISTEYFPTLRIYNKGQMLKELSPIGNSSYIKQEILAALGLETQHSNNSNQTTETENNINIQSSSPSSSLYQKAVKTNNILIETTSSVSDQSLYSAANTVLKLSSKLKQIHPDIYQELLNLKYRVSILPRGMHFSNLPEFKKYGTAFDGAAGVTTDPQDSSLISVREEMLPPHHYSFSVLEHEFAHAVHFTLKYMNDSRCSQITSAYRKAMNAGLWRGKYASTNEMEYFAEAARSFLNNGNKSDAPMTKEELKSYDPEIYNIVSEIF